MIQSSALAANRQSSRAQATVLQVAAAGCSSSAPPCASVKLLKSCVQIGPGSPCPFCIGHDPHQPKQPKPSRRHRNRHVCASNSVPSFFFRLELGVRHPPKRSQAPSSRSIVFVGCIVPTMPYSPRVALKPPTRLRFARKKSISARVLPRSRSHSTSPRRSAAPSQSARTILRVCDSMRRAGPAATVTLSGTRRPRSRMSRVLGRLPARCARRRPPNACSDRLAGVHGAASRTIRFRSGGGKGCRVQKCCPAPAICSLAVAEAARTDVTCHTRPRRLCPHRRQSFRLSCAPVRAP
jgi:hypothetical protein